MPFRHSAIPPVPVRPPQGEHQKASACGVPEMLKRSKHCYFFQCAVEICSNVEEFQEFTSLNWFISQRWCKTLEPLETKGVGPSASCPKFMPFQDEHFGRYLSKQRHELGNM
jgi:hypothetical protein